MDDFDKQFEVVARAGKIAGGLFACWMVFVGVFGVALASGVLVLLWKLIQKL